MIFKIEDVQKLIEKAHDSAKNNPLNGAGTFHIRVLLEFIRAGNIRFINISIKWRKEYGRGPFRF